MSRLALNHSPRVTISYKLIHPSNLSSPSPYQNQNQFPLYKQNPIPQNVLPPHHNQPPPPSRPNHIHQPCCPNRTLRPPHPPPQRHASLPSALRPTDRRRDVPGPADPGAGHAVRGAQCDVWRRGVGAAESWDGASGGDGVFGWVGGPGGGCVGCLEVWWGDGESCMGGCG